MGGHYKAGTMTQEITEARSRSFRLNLIRSTRVSNTSGICSAFSAYAEAVLAIRPGRPWPTQTRSWPTQAARVIPMIPTYTTSVGLPKLLLAFDWPTQMKIPKTAPVHMADEYLL